ncbi:hypothetical protein BRADI_2g54095v3 [Brachypodium distachyon]|uniref:Uncharacterized protein n=1 Tax=Brachypodium distachyon TaxID=15368 RepID=A0A2K2DFR4_BRADI|nr:hypothetical protein BRADI_2g54095v3 [Brachypodium distachyon]
MSITMQGDAANSEAKRQGHHLRPHGLSGAKARWPQQYSQYVLVLLGHYVLGRAVSLSVSLVVLAGAEGSPTPRK